MGTNNLPVILDYQGSADLPSVYNELADSVQAALDTKLDTAAPSTSPSTSGYKRIFVGSSAPGSPQVGDVWLQI